MKGTICYVGVLRGSAKSGRPTRVLVGLDPDAPKYGFGGIRVAYTRVYDRDEWDAFNLKQGDRVEFRVRDPWHLVRL